MLFDVLQPEVETPEDRAGIEHPLSDQVAALVLARLNKCGEALQIANRVLEIQPGNAEAKKFQADAQKMSEEKKVSWRLVEAEHAIDEGNADTAETLIGEVLKMEPENKRALRLQTQLGDARTRARHALDEQRDEGRARD